MTDYYKLMRLQVLRQAAEQYGIIAHSAYDCDWEDCRLCRDFHIDEKIDRATDERKEKGGEC